jgi:DNA-binding response OmpR family regulator
MSKRILLIEDDEDVYDFLKPFLSGRGYEVDVATDGEVGLKKVADWKPDLVILDLMMPNVDGFGVLRALSGRPAGSPPRIIVVTAVQKRGGADEAMRLGASGFLTKPIDNEQLLETIQNTL